MELRKWAISWRKEPLCWSASLITEPNDRGWGSYFGRHHVQPGDKAIAWHHVTLWIRMGVLFFCVSLYDFPSVRFQS